MTRTAAELSDDVQIHCTLAEYPAAAFSWMCISGNASADAAWNAAHTGMKSVTLTAAELSTDVQIQCTLAGTSPAYGTVSVDDTFLVRHTRGEADRNDTLHLENGLLSVTTDGDNYRLAGNDLTALYPQLNGSVTASAWVYRTQPTKTIEFKYNSAGLRVSKIVNGMETKYLLNGKQVMHLTVGNDKLHFFYDAQGWPAKVNYNGVIYTYIHNLQGDVVGLLDNAGALVVEYKYDAWGRPIASTGSMAATLGKRNPFRYRGYIYDEETGLYYLRSRYYNPLVGRFVNADDTIKPKALLSSVYAYCANKPVVRVDYSGKLYLSIELYTIALSARLYEKFDFSKTLLATKFTKRIRASTVMKKRVADYIKAIPKGEKSYSKTELINWDFRKSLENLSMSDLDLALSVGHASDMTITVEKVDKGFFESIYFWGDKYKVTYTLNDKYDFERWAGTNRDAALIWLNDTLGYEPQEAGLLNEYYYTCTDSYYVYVYD